MAGEPTQPGDTRSTQQVFTQWRKLQEIKRTMVKEGTLNGDASPAQVIAKLREQIPPDLFL